MMNNNDKQQIIVEQPDNFYTAFIEFINLIGWVPTFFLGVVVVGFSYKAYLKVKTFGKKKRRKE